MEQVVVQAQATDHGEARHIEPGHRAIAMLHDRDPGLGVHDRLYRHHAGLHLA